MEGGVVRWHRRLGLRVLGEAGDTGGGTATQVPWAHADEGEDGEVILGETETEIGIGIGTGIETGTGITTDRIGVYLLRGGVLTRHLPAEDGVIEAGVVGARVLARVHAARPGGGDTIDLLTVKIVDACVCCTYNEILQASSLTPVFRFLKEAPLQHHTQYSHKIPLQVVILVCCCRLQI